MRAAYSVHDMRCRNEIVPTTNEALDTSGPGGAGVVDSIDNGGKATRGG